MKTFISDTAFEMSYWWKSTLVLPIKKFFIGIANMWKWKGIVYNDRWWDYEYFLDIMLFKLKIMREHWGRDTHYIHDYIERDTLDKLIIDLEWLIEADEFQEGYEEKYQKTSKRFFSMLDRHHRKLSD